jgi:3-hydroxyacyl-[acyl-carrier-protein] dehydratase
MNDSLRLGADVIRHLLPHRRPFLMVDFVAAYAREPRPRLTAGRHISSNEEVFTGHFPNLSLWPGVFTIEGLGQACNILAVLVGLERAWKEQGREVDEVVAALRALERGYKLQPAASPAAAQPLVEALRTADLVGFSAAVDIRFLQPVFAGQRLDYLVELTHWNGDILRFEVEAQVDGAPVARGTHVSSRRKLPHLPGA